MHIEHAWLSCDTLQLSRITYFGQRLFTKVLWLFRSMKMINTHENVSGEIVNVVPLRICSCPSCYILRISVDHDCNNHSQLKLLNFSFIYINFCFVSINTKNYILKSNKNTLVFHHFLILSCRNIYTYICVVRAMHRNRKHGILQ